MNVVILDVDLYKVNMYADELVFNMKILTFYLITIRQFV